MAEEMTLTSHSRPAISWKVGEAELEVTAGKSLKIETSPAGVDVLDAEVPVGKVWTVTIGVNIIEEDA